MSIRDEGRIHLAQLSDTCWRVTMAFPPLNIIGPVDTPRPEETVWPLESDDRVKFVVFDCAVDEFLSDSL
jgi:hypothetical protein